VASPICGQSFSKAVTKCGYSVPLSLTRSRSETRPEYDQTGVGDAGKSFWSQQSRGAVVAEHPNVARIRRGYEIRGTTTDFTDEGRAEIEDLFDQDLVYHGQGTSRFAQDFHGRDEFFAVERSFAKTGSMRQEVKKVFADDVHAIVLVEVYAEHEGNTTTWEEAEVFHFGPDGKVTDTWGIPADQNVVDGFWASAMGAGT
jgi:hypothetical protein